MPKQIAWKPWCPLGGVRKYANKHMVCFYKVDQAKRRLCEHLKGNGNHDLTAQDAEDEVDRFEFEQCRGEETWDDEPAAVTGNRSAASKSHVRPPRSPAKKEQKPLTDSSCSAADNGHMDMGRAPSQGLMNHSRTPSSSLPRRCANVTL